MFRNRRAQAQCAECTDALEEANPPDRRQHRGVRICGSDRGRRGRDHHCRPRPLCRGKAAGTSSRSLSIEVQGLSEAKRRALALADNKIAENAGWDRELLAVELPELAEILVVEGLDISITGFAPVEIDQLTADFEEDASDPADAVDPEWIDGHSRQQTGRSLEIGPSPAALRGCAQDRRARSPDGRWPRCHGLS